MIKVNYIPCVKLEDVPEEVQNSCGCDVIQGVLQIAAEPYPVESNPLLKSWVEKNIGQYEYIIIKK